MNKKQIKSVYSEELMSKLARLHYVEKLPMKEIASRLKTSSPRVGRILEAAEKAGIVKIHVRSGQNDPEQALMDKFDLIKVRVVETHRDYKSQLEVLGKAAAEVFEDLLLERGRMTRVAISGGETIHAFVTALPETSRQIAIAPTALFSRDTFSKGNKFDAPFLAMALAWKSGDLASAQVFALPPPPSNNKNDARRYTDLMVDANGHVNAVLQAATSADIFFLTAQDWRPGDPMLNPLRAVGLEEQLMEERGVVGGLNFSFFDQDGENVTYLKEGQKKVMDRHPFLPAVGLAALQSAAKTPHRYVTLVSGGIHKLRATEVALKKGYANSLITDSATAASLLNR